MRIVFVKSALLCKKRKSKKKVGLMRRIQVLKLGIIQARGRVEFGEEGDEAVGVVSCGCSSGGGCGRYSVGSTRRIVFFHWITKEA